MKVREEDDGVRAQGTAGPAKVRGTADGVRAQGTAGPAKVRETADAEKARGTADAAKAREAADAVRIGRSRRPWAALVLLGVPVLAALLGPWAAGGEPSAEGALPSRPPGAGHPLGTDVLGRDVLWLVLHGGASVLGSALAALAVGMAAGVPLGLLAAGPRRGLDEAVMRGLDLLLAFPGLLVLMTLAATGHRDRYWLVAVAGVLQIPAVARLVRGAALAPGSRTVVEALRMQGRGWAYIHLRHLARQLAAPLATDAGGRFSVVLYLLASANFLGLGLPASSPDWAVLIERNSDALFTQPAAVLVPAGLLTALCVGGNLLVDRTLARARRGR
ncbi:MULTISPECIES: ABC transporter permease [unclassified Streptomyces]|uniref:ABC transporter permease n=1 Tax=unclassified Streptomyces TaxID=2593676 RepID=UPI0001C1C521|nr:MULTISPECIES: ABC transporter permease [unclassified Streptomyces]AEN12107.1 binding-protein-dependent transport systems inner membrane component [Streptomyces sp. SirexAA-E]PZX38830.1 peptide/nickel transport system permease protein [Streptomyces sp. DvalAA-21]RAJ35163.1 peptide/nickel transport system permease protein [Streptomyces sp. DpondAA-E10]RAJ49031.1 peptide/nickel transport system permease protein [Streptomyces sp. DpondAA-A50]SCE40864.1 peptide/nickel transport system permease p